MMRLAKGLPLSVAALVLASEPVWPQSMVRGGGPWEVSCPYDQSKALLPVTCGRLTVPENPERPGRAVEIAFMVVRAPRTIDQHGPVVFLNGGPGQVSLHYFEHLVTHPHIRDVVVDRDWIVALVASWLPARRASRVDPVSALLAA